VNNFGEKDIDNKEVVYKILALTKNYNKDERRELTLSFSGGEPTLNKNLVHYIALAKKI
jgi:organic radical activating enzyme